MILSKPVNNTHANIVIFKYKKQCFFFYHGNPAEKIFIFKRMILPLNIIISKFFFFGTTKILVYVSVS